MPLLFTMSLFGSIGTLIYLVLLPWAKRYLPVRWRRYYLICNILEYSIPFPYCNVRYKEVLESVCRKGLLPRVSVEEALFTDFTMDVIQITADRIYIPNIAVYILIVVIVIIGVGILYRWSGKYKKIKYFLRNNAVPVTDPTSSKVIKECGSIYKKALRVYQCRAVDTPFIIGVVCPVVILPYREWDTAELEMVIEHETIHILQWDNLIKILAFAVLAFNFYNPLAWYLLYQWNAVAELSCDRKIIANRTREEVKSYGLLMVEIAKNQTENRNMPIMGFSMQNKIMKERIDQMKNGVKKESVLKKLMGAGVLGITLFSASLSVFAYSPKYVRHTNEIADQMFFTEEDMMWGNVDMDLPVNENGGWMFFGEEGVTIERLDDLNLDLEIYSYCEHDYVSGKTTKHVKYSDNSCKVEYYAAKKCSKCGEVVLGEWLNTATYKKCPH